MFFFPGLGSIMVLAVRLGFDRGLKESTPSLLSILIRTCIHIKSNSTCPLLYLFQISYK